MNLESAETPLVSFCVMCFNQERYIGEALEGAFAQTYRPLEIVISDDASTDRSWQIITESVAEYRRRPDAAEVVLNRNEANKGNIGNWTALCSLAKGRLLVKADGDDVSCPERTARIVAAWKAGGRRAMVISNGGMMIGPRGQRMGRMWQVNATWVAGAMMTFDRATFDVFGCPANLDAMDDEVFARRALMLGPEIVLTDSLVKYRLGTGRSNSLWHVREPLSKARKELVVALDQSRRDLETARSRISEADYASWLARLDSDRIRTEAEVTLMDGSSFAARRAACRRLGRVPLLSVRQFLRCAFLLPRPMGDGLLFCYAVVRYVMRRVKGVLGL